MSERVRGASDRRNEGLLLLQMMRQHDASYPDRRVISSSFRLRLSFAREAARKRERERDGGVVSSFHRKVHEHFDDQAMDAVTPASVWRVCDPHARDGESRVAAGDREQTAHAVTDSASHRLRGGRERGSGCHRMREKKSASQSAGMRVSGIRSQQHTKDQRK